MKSTFPGRVKKKNVHGCRKVKICYHLNLECSPKAHMLKALPKCQKNVVELEDMDSNEALSVHLAVLFQRIVA